MLSERVQASLLVKQNLLNIWRKRAFARLAATASTAPGDSSIDGVADAIALFREAVDNGVANVLQAPHTYRDTLEKLIAKHGANDSAEEQALTQKVRLL